jgi:DNA-binding protein HU-beta
MTKSELITAVAEKSELSKKDADKAIDALVSTIYETLKAGDKVQVMGFGSFEVKERAARKGVNPSTGEPIDIPASKSPVFRAGKAFKDTIK